MFSQGFKRPQIYSYQTPALSSVHSIDINGSKARHIQSKKDSEMSILQKLNSSKLKNIEDIDISSKIILHKGPHDSRSKYFVLGQDQNSMVHKVKIHNQPYKYNQVKDNILTFSPLKLQNKYSQSSANLKAPHQNKQNIISKVYLRQRFLKPTQSWIQKITPQKLAKAPSHHPNKSLHERQPFAPLSIHEQLYLGSKKKEIKRSAEQIIQNQYFKKAHPFKPEVSHVSQFLAQQKRSKIKEREKFEKEFEEFSEWKEQRSLKKQKCKEPRREQMDMFDMEKHKQSQQKQSELKNYTILKHFFFYLSQNEPILSYQNLIPQKLCELPSPCIKLLEPILQQYYKNKKTRKLTWLQFLSEFNLKIKKSKAFYLLIEKWFWIKYKLRFDSKCKEAFYQDENCTKLGNQLDSTYVGQSTICQEDHGSRAKLKKLQ